MYLIAYRCKPLSRRFGSCQQKGYSCIHTRRNPMKKATAHECQLYKVKSKDGSLDVECTACSRRCVIANNDTGYCSVRYNQGGKLYLSVYGYPCAIQIDPIEKKPLFHFLPGSSVLSLGAIGCNFRCSFCQNWDISQAARSIKQSVRDKGGSMIEIEDIATHMQGESPYVSPQSIVHLALQNKCRSVAFTYNEPSIWGEYAHDIAKEAKARGLRTVYVTNGYLTEEHLQFIRPYVDAMNIDLKAWSPRFYREICGGTLPPVLHTIRMAWRLGFWVEVTTLLVPRENDDMEDLRAMAAFLCEVAPSIPWHLTAFHPAYRMMGHASTSGALLEEAWTIGKEAGLKHVYIGNRSSPHENTTCPQCGKVLLERENSEGRCLDEESFRGVCSSCGEVIHGVWK